MGGTHLWPEGMRSESVFEYEHMIFAHGILGALPVENGAFSLAWFLGSIAPDIDHVFVFYRNRKLGLKNLRNSFYFEEKYQLHYKTPFVHSLLGAMLVSSPVFFFGFYSGLLFFIAYIIHLLIDWLDIDEKQYLYPFKWKVKGNLPIFSKPERWIIIMLVIAVLFIYKFFI